MIEIVNPAHPDKVADRIAGAIVDLAYFKSEDRPKIAVEVLVGHKTCTIIAETSVHFDEEEIKRIVDRIAPGISSLNYIEEPQDVELAKNQKDDLRAGDNGIFKGVLPDEEEVRLYKIAKKIYEKFPTDGKYILDGDILIICQSNAYIPQIKNYLESLGELTSGLRVTINPLGYWTGGTNVDTGATNRKLGSDMGKGVTGGGLHGKDLSKADTSLNICAFMQSMDTGRVCEMSCAIGDKNIYLNEEYRPYNEMVEKAAKVINVIGGFEKFAEWGLHSFIDVE